MTAVVFDNHRPDAVPVAPERHQRLFPTPYCLNGYCALGVPLFASYFSPGDGEWGRSNVNTFLFFRAIGMPRWLRRLNNNQRIRLL